MDRAMSVLWLYLAHPLLDSRALDRFKVRVSHIRIFICLYAYILYNFILANMFVNMYVYERLVALLGAPSSRQPRARPLQGACLAYIHIRIWVFTCLLCIFFMQICIYVCYLWLSTYTHMFICIFTAYMFLCKYVCIYATCGFTSRTLFSTAARSITSRCVSRTYTYTYMCIYMSSLYIYFHANMYVSVALLGALSSRQPHVRPLQGAIRARCTGFTAHAHICVYTFLYTCTCNHTYTCNMYMYTYICMSI